jgi:hypothetical protein
VEWEALAARGQARYEDGSRRLPEEPDSRQRQLVRMAMAAGATALARLMQGRRDEASRWFRRSSERYRESFEGAPPESWGRAIGALKARVLGSDWEGAESDAAWTLGLRPAASPSPIGKYAAVLGLLVLGRDEAAGHVASSLLAEPEDAFPGPVARALAALAAAEDEAYADAVRAVLESFESREAHLEDVPVADTVLVLEALAERRGMRVGLTSPLLPDEMGAGPTPGGPSRT